MPRRAAGAGSGWPAPTVIGATSGAPPAKVRATSRSFHTQRNWKMPNAASAGVSSGSSTRKKIWHVTGAVDPGRLEQRGRDLLHEVVQQEDRQRQREDRVGQPDRPERAREPGVDVERQQRDQRDLDRHDLQGEDRDEQRCCCPGSRSRRTRTRPAAPALIGMMHRRDDDHERVDEELAEARGALGAQHVAVVVQRELWVGERRSTSRVVLIARSGRNDEMSRPKVGSVHSTAMIDRRQRRPGRGEPLLGHRSRGDRRRR